MENRSLQRQAKEQQRKKEICYQCQKAKDRAGRKTCSAAKSVGGRYGMSKLCG